MRFKKFVCHFLIAIILISTISLFSQENKFNNAIEHNHVLSSVMNMVNTNNAYAATCVHTYTSGYEKVHPHMNYKTCTKCYSSYYTGSNTYLSSCCSCAGHSWVAGGYEAVHPHKVYTKCSKCYQTSYTGGTKTLTTCATCTHIHSYTTKTVSSTHTTQGHVITLKCACGATSSGGYEKLSSCTTCYHTHNYTTKSISGTHSSLGHAITLTCSCGATSSGGYEKQSSCTTCYHTHNYTTKAVSATHSSLGHAITLSCSCGATSAGGYEKISSCTLCYSETDSTVPSAPTNLSNTKSGTTLYFSWNASSDNVGVVGYKIYRNGSYINYVTGTTCTCSTVALPVGSYNYTVKAYDAAGNLSATSNSANDVVYGNLSSATINSPIAGNTSSTSIVAQWVSVTNATSYTVALRDLSTNTLLVNTSTTGMSYSLPTLTRGHEYRLAIGTTATYYSTGWSQVEFSIDTQEPPQKPTVIASPTTATNGNVIVSASFSSNTTTKEYSKDGGQWTTYTSGIQFVTNGSIRIRAQNSWGLAETTWNVNNIDKIPPGAPSVVADIYYPTDGKVTVTATFSTDSVVKQYSIDSGTSWNDYIGGVVFASNGSVMCRSKDGVGNISGVTTFNVGNIYTTTSDTNPYDNMGWGYMFTDLTFTYISSGYKTANRPDHKGIDIAHSLINNKPVKNVYGGTVLYEYDNNKDLGRCIVIETDSIDPVTNKRLIVRYMHMKELVDESDDLYIEIPVFTVGDRISKGTVLGFVSNTGDVSPKPADKYSISGTHLHFDVNKEGKLNAISVTDVINPEKFFTGIPLRGDLTGKE